MDSSLFFYILALHFCFILPGVKAWIGHSRIGGMDGQMHGNQYGHTALDVVTTGQYFFPRLFAHVCVIANAPCPNVYFGFDSCLQQTRAALFLYDTTR
ncbi:hypothetical protein BJ166DRAFT_375438 [Pestalotiopsis sp. NC0098]|nr:hypothetical protein BJ166DRAFT_375438 [Pestalotiopsis sp. NC0098]